MRMGILNLLASAAWASQVRFFLNLDNLPALDQDLHALSREQFTPFSRPAFPRHSVLVKQEPNALRHPDMVNLIVGTGVFATTPTFLAQSGSVELMPSLRLRFLVTVVNSTTFKRRTASLSTLSPLSLLRIQAAGNAYRSGEYFLRAGGNEVVDYIARGIGVSFLLPALIIHGFFR